MRRRSRITALLGAVLLLLSGSAAADDPAPADDPKIVEARAEYVRGNELAKTTQWAQALAAFEHSNELRPHALTTYNMAVCERALGRFTRAKDLFVAAVAAAETDPGQIPASRLDEARSYTKELDEALVHLDVRVDPSDTSIAVDGRPLKFAPDANGHERAIAGVAAPGPGTIPPRSTFPLVLDPGTHIFRVAAKGYGDVLLTKTYRAGETTKLDIALARLPAMFRITSNVLDPIVTINGTDVGAAPVSVSRPAGTYQIVVKKTGFETFDTKLGVTPGQEVDLPARLSEERTPPLTKRWWFWTAIGGALAGGAVLTYALTREDPAPTPYQGGTTGWVLTPR